MSDKNLSQIEFNDIAFMSQENRKAIILFGKTKETAKNLHKAMQKGFNFKVDQKKMGITLLVLMYTATILH